MKIGILTFHWATNYGAVLQCYALQCYLESRGHNVKVINYKPGLYDETFYKFLRYRKFLHLKEFICKQKKEKSLERFRCEHLKMTERIYACSAISSIASRFDIIISGSDQVVNPYFLMSGEGYHSVTPTYFLGFPFNGIRIGYALSFGCVKYPDEALKVASQYIDSFNSIGVREVSGWDIVKSMGREDAVIVPDPTLLQPSSFYHVLANEFVSNRHEEYVYSFFIRNIEERKRVINKVLNSKNIIWNTADGEYSIESWLHKIKHAEFVVTDSFHCVVMCLKFQTPFAVITDIKGNKGMNDRLYTLLTPLGLKERIIFKESISYETLFCSIDWEFVNRGLEKVARQGCEFLNMNL